MFRRKNVDMLHGPIVKGLLSMTMPIMAMNVLQNIFNLIDMWALGFFANDNAVGAVGACGMLIALCTCLLTGTSIGANVIVARHIGEGDREKTERATGTAVLFSILGGIVLMVFGLIFAETFLRWTNCPEEILPQAVLYFRGYFIGVPVIFAYSFCASILRATGDANRPMTYSIVGGGAKVVLTFLLLGLLRLDIVGVIVATILANALSGILSYYTLSKGNDKTTVSLKTMKIDWAELKAILHVGIPTGLQTGFHSFANVLITATVNSLGPAATTGISIANHFDGILYNITYAPSLATTPYVAQNIGAGNIKRAKSSIGKSIWIAIAFGASLGSLSAIFSGPLSSLISKNPEVIAYSQQKMIIISSTYFICGINEIMGGALRGMGKPIFPTVATFIFMCALRFVWVYAAYPFFPEAHKLTLLYLVWPIGWILSITTLLLVYFPGMRKLQKQQALKDVSGATL